MKIVNPVGKDFSSKDSFKAYRTCICSETAMDGREPAQYSGPGGNTCMTCNFNCSDDGGENHQANRYASMSRNYE